MAAAGGAGGAVAVRYALVAALVASCVTRPPVADGVGAPTRWRRTVTAVDAPRALRVTTCFEGSPPPRVRLRSGATSTTLRRAMDGTTLAAMDGVVTIPPDTRCVVNDLAAADFTEPDGTYLLRNSDWLWAPDPWMPGLRIDTRFELPDGTHVSTPWGDDAMDVTALQWQGYTVVGPFAQETLAVEGTTLDVVRLGAAARGEIPVSDWLGGAIRAIRTLDPALPLPRVQVLLTPTYHGPEGVGFGLVSRGGGRSTLFTVDPSAGPSAFRGDWQATHEFTHLLQPVFYDDDAWFGEGLATYYQEVLRARVGAIPVTQCWEDLLRGLRAGLAEGSDATLAEESAAMRRTRRYVRVYWWGTAVALTLDVALRRAGTGSLDAGVRAVHAAAARAPERAWRATEALRVMDEAMGTTACGAMGREALAAQQYPDVMATLRELGVRAEDGGVVRFDDGAPLAAVREAITRRP